MHYYFDWDPDKAKTNSKKHKVSFEQATTVFHDPNTISVFDSEHSETEDRWITIGIDKNGILLVIIHTYQQLNKNKSKIRLISARKATKIETVQYKEVNK